MRERGEVRERKTKRERERKREGERERQRQRERERKTEKEREREGGGGGGGGGDTEQSRRHSAMLYALVGTETASFAFPSLPLTGRRFVPCKWLSRVTAPRSARLLVIIFQLDLLFDC